MAWIRACGGGSPAVPNGKTVTPINDVTIWQQCAGIANPTYTKLSEVLADTGILSTLMASNNAVDYLVRSKAFIESVNIVPTMTSDTTPIGVASMPSVVSGYPAYYAFDGNDSTRCATSAAYSGVTYQFPTPQCVKRAYAIHPIGAGSSFNIKFEASNDGSTWTTLYTGTWDLAGTSFDLSSNNDSYLYYRFVTTDNWQLSVATLEYYTLPQGICDNSNAMTYIGQNNYASNTLLADSDWASAIYNSDYFASVLNLKVPKMTGYGTPSGYVYDSGYSGGAYGWLAFDRNDVDGDYWLKGDLSSGSGKWLTYDFGSSKNIKIFEIMPAYNSGGGGACIKSFKIQGSNDNSSWTDLYSATLSNNGNKTKHILTNNGDYRYYRLYTTSNPYYYAGGYSVGVVTLQYYGREDV